MKNRILILFIFLPLLLFSCSRKRLPSKTTPIVITNDCDSLIKESLKTLQNQPTNIPCDDSSFVDFCNILKMHNIDLIKKLSDKDYNILILNQVVDSLEKRPLTYIDNSKHKIKTKIKDSNNQIENTKLKNSLQIKDSQLDSVSFENLALNGKVKDLEKELIKNKNSTTGNQSPNKSGNITKNSNFWYGVLTGALGLFTLIIGFKLIRSYLSPISIIT